MQARCFNKYMYKALWKQRQSKPGGVMEQWMRKASGKMYLES